VAEDTVQDPNNNPNEAQTEGFTFASPANTDPSVDSLSVEGQSTQDGGSTTTSDDTPTVTGQASDSDGTIADVRYQIDGGGFQSASPSDGTFDEGTEGFTFTTSSLSEGKHDLEVVAEDNDGDTSNTWNVEVTVDAEDPTVQSVETAPGSNDLYVTFSEGVDCGNVDNDWNFTNDSTQSLDGGEAQGSPDDVSNSANSALCVLGWPNDGVEADDFGALDYTGTSVTELTADNSQAKKFNNEDVIDTVAPTLDDITPDAANDEVTLTFSEGIACNTFDNADLDVKINGASTGYTVATCNDPDDQPVISTNNGFGVGDNIEVEVTGPFTDESGDNTASGSDSELAS
jgi:hypothetical protein